MIQHYQLPSGARNVQQLGNHWCTFELVIDGKVRKFLLHYYVNGSNYASESITELRSEQNHLQLRSAQDSSQYLDLPDGNEIPDGIYRVSPYHPPLSCSATNNYAERKRGRWFVVDSGQCVPDEDITWWEGPLASWCGCWSAQLGGKHED